MGNGFPYICRKWQLNLMTAFRTNGNPRVLPINVFQIQGNDGTSTQTEPGQENQNRVIPASDGRPSLIALQHSSYAAGGEELGQSRKRPTGDRGHTNGLKSAEEAARVEGPDPGVTDTVVRQQLERTKSGGRADIEHRATANRLS
jgi:hypothetical protein